MMKEYTIYTDGACDNMAQQRGGSWAYVVVEDDKVIDTKSGFEKFATNNQMELKAIFNALLYVSPDSTVRIVTDSKYCIGVLGQGWKARVNQELIKLIAEVERNKNLKLEYRWVRGHSGNKFNELADELASKEYYERTGLRQPDYHKKKEISDEVDYKSELFDLCCAVEMFLNCRRLHKHNPTQFQTHLEIAEHALNLQMDRANKLTEGCF